MSAGYSRDDLLEAAGIVRDLLSDRDYDVRGLSANELMDESWLSYSKWAAEQVAERLEDEARIGDQFAQSVQDVIRDFIYEMEYLGDLARNLEQAEVFWAAHDEGYEILWYLKETMELQYEEDEWM